MNKNLSEIHVSQEDLEDTPFTTAIGNAVVIRDIQWWISFGNRGNHRAGIINPLEDEGDLR